MKKQLAITADCVCDLSDDMLDDLAIKVIYFYITTDNGCFKDMDEITAGNVVEYFARGGKFINTDAPEVEEYEELFEKVLRNSEEIIHITIASKLSRSYARATQAAKKFAGKVHVFDTGHLSTGIGHLVIKAVEMAQEGKNASEILEILESKKDKISTSFIADKVDYLYRNGRVNKAVMLLCSTFKIHPVLTMKGGYLKIKTVYIGNYEKCVLRYARRELKKAAGIEKKRVFITHASCPLRIINKVRDFMTSQCPFEEIYVTDASATITSNCGANTLGVLFVRE